MKNDNLKNQYRVNEQIRANEVRIVGDDIESMVLPTSKALRMAEEKGVDLVEISPTANPPVCRLIEYSKFIYQQKKRQKEQKAKQVKIDVKEIRFGPQTDEHDYNFKLKHAISFTCRNKFIRFLIVQRYFFYIYFYSVGLFYKIYCIVDNSKVPKP